MIYLPMLLAVTAGLRISEITGLRYSDIDFLGRKLFVERQLGKNLYIEKEQENRPVLCSELPLKTKNSKRAVVLADFVLDEILLERQRYEKRKASDPEFLDLGYICCHENGQCHNRSFYIKSYNRLMEQSGISRLPWRKFRNTYATVLAQYQVNMKTISKCLGHYSPDFTSRIYVASQKQETYDISKIIEEYVLAHHLLSKEQGCVELKRQCNVEQKPTSFPILMLIGIIFMIKISFTFYNKISRETERLQLKSLLDIRDLLAEVQHPVRICISEKVP